ncbi:MAG: hypothetical protein Q9195_004401 [Heterodermia aff. obscurata]
MLSSLLALLALLPIINAQSTVSLFLPFFGDGDRALVASVSSSDKTATTYTVTCASGASGTVASATPTSFNDGSDSSDGDDDCQIGPQPLTVTQGPSTVNLVYTVDVITATIDCIFQGTTSATCTASQTGANDVESSMTESMESVPSVITTTLGSDSLSFIPVTITAGAVKGETSASATDAGATANPAAGNVRSTIATKTAPAASTGAASNQPAGTSTSANPIAATSTGGATVFDSSSVLGASVIVAMGLAAAML